VPYTGIRFCALLKSVLDAMPQRSAEQLFSFLSVVNVSGAEWSKGSSVGILNGPIWADAFTRDEQRNESSSPSGFTTM
jgi:hypothetical protein